MSGIPSAAMTVARIKTDSERWRFAMEKSISAQINKATEIPIIITISQVDEITRGQFEEVIASCEDFGWVATILPDGATTEMENLREGYLGTIDRTDSILSEDRCFRARLTPRSL